MCGTSPLPPVWNDSDSEITEFCPRTEEANNTSGDGDSSEDSFPSLSFSRCLGPQSAHCVLRGRHNGPLVRLIVSGMHLKTRHLKPLFVAFWQSRGADLHPEDSVTVSLVIRWNGVSAFLHVLRATLLACSELPLVTCSVARDVDVEAGLCDLHVNLGTGQTILTVHSYSHTAKSWVSVWLVRENNVMHRSNVGSCLKVCDETVHNAKRFCV